MKNKLILSMLCALGALLVVTAAPAGAKSSLPSKTQWLADVHTAMAGGDSYLDSRVAQGGTKLAIVTDVDNTALETHYNEGKATPDVLDFANHGKALKVVLLVDTHRTDASGATKDMTKAGYAVTETCAAKKGEDTATGKQRCRQQFVNEGYTIIANVGNNPTDFTGANYEKAFQLPNYNGQLS